MMMLWLAVFPGSAECFVNQGERGGTDEHRQPEVGEDRATQGDDRKPREALDEEQRVHGDGGSEAMAQPSMRPRTTTTAAPSMAKPITFKPSPTGSVSVTVTVGAGGGGLGGASEQELNAMKPPTADSSMRDFKGRFVGPLDGG